jgi:uncharacterized protein (PEP-CTERM system associated)
MATAPGDAQRRLQSGPGNSTIRRDPIRLQLLSAGLFTLLASPAWPAKWDIVPSLSVAEIYTDNLSLAPDAFKQNGWVTQVIPGISIAAIGAGLRFRANYTPELIYYSQEGADNKVYQQLNAVGTAELAKQLLFVDAGALIGPESISLQGPLTESNIYTTGNRATVRTYFVSPYLRHNFGSAVQGEARFHYSVWKSDEATILSDSTANRGSLRLASGPAYKLLTWNLTYARETVDYERQEDTHSEVTLANARQLITPAIGLLAQAGREHYDSGAVGPVSEGSRWAAGLEWTPTPRTRLTATGGERFYGHAYFLDLSHRTRLTAWSAGYTEDVSNTRTESLALGATSTVGYLDPLFLSRYPDPEARQKAVEEVIVKAGLPPNVGAPVNFFSGQLFTVKKWHASAGLLGVRNIVIAYVYRETREALAGNVVVAATEDFAASRIVRQSGTGLAWSWRLTAQDTWILNAGISRNEFLDTGRVDDLADIRMGLTRQLQPRVSAALFYRRQQNESNRTLSSYTENSVSAILQMKF